jgi:D-glycerate 3-kinase
MSRMILTPVDVKKGERQLLRRMVVQELEANRSWMATDQSVLSILERDLDAALAAGGPRPLVYGVSGAQGSGKSTVARRLVESVRMRGGSAEVLSIDDLYFGRRARRRLARTAHPLFITRGPPGTHDIDLGEQVLCAVKAGESVRLPRFDKARDEPLAASEWRLATAGLDALIVEGWCLGASPESGAELALPVNTLERAFDADGRWRRFVNKALQGDYQRFFQRVDRLIFLKAPDFDIVWRWRAEQEHALAAANMGRSAPGLMLDDELHFFIQHFERVTRAMLQNPPRNASLVLELNARRNVVNILRTAQEGA